MLKSNCAPTPSSGLETSPSTEGPTTAPAAISRIISGTRVTVARNWATRPAPKMRPKSRSICSTSTAYPPSTSPTSLSASVPQLKDSTLLRRTTSPQRLRSSSGNAR